VERETGNAVTNTLLEGEFLRTLDARYRVSIPPELSKLLGGESANCILVKERPGALSLWAAADWQSRHDQGVQLVHNKLAAGRLDGRLADVQRLGRLLSTRHRSVQLAGRGRLVIPEGFREFLGVAAGGDLMIVGAALCAELWNPAAWLSYLQDAMPDFQQLFDGLTA
jgi:MraZ protein